MLEDQLCGFTTQGYRGEGSPDRADALVWALTDLMLGHADGWGVFEYYRQEATSTKADQQSVTVAAANTIKLKVPGGVSTVHGMSGQSYLVDATGIVELTEDDAKPLLDRGFKRVEAQDVST